ncbi:MAG: FtsX-like permease family protein [Syntrophobacteraceae bacterium]
MSAFIRLWIWFSLRQFRRHLWRSIAVLLGIGLGAAVFTSVRLSTNAAVQSFANSVDTVSGKADRTVVQPGGRVPEKLVADLLRSPEVRAASPLMSAYVRAGGENVEPLLLIGIDPILDRPFRNWKADEGDSARVAGAGDSAVAAGAPWRELMSSPGTIIAGRSFLAKNGLRTGDNVPLQSTNRGGSFRILAELAPGGLASLEGGNVAICDIATFQEFTGVFGEVDRIDLLLAPPVTAEKSAALAKMLPRGLSLEHPSEARETGQAMIRSYQLNLSVLSFVSLFVGMFLVYSLISLHATSRRKELAVMRSVGASPRMIFSLFIAEGAAFGLLGWVIAIPTSLFMTERLVGRVSSTVSHLFARIHVEGLGLTAREVVFSFVVTVLVAVAAACQPAIEASGVRAREALLMRDAPVQEESGLVRRLGLLGLALAATIWPLSRMPAVSGVPVPGYLATFFLFLSFALLSPIFLRAAGSFLPPLARKIAGETAYLGTRYLKDAGARVAISAGALITAIGLFAALAIMVHSFRDTVHAWVYQSINGDLYVRPKMSDINRYRDPLPPGAVEELKKLENDIELIPYRRVFLSRGGAPYLIEPIDTGRFLERSGFLFMEGSPEETGAKLDAGEGVLVSEVFSNQTGLRRGDRFRAVVEGAELDFPILGITRDYRTQGGVVHMSLAQFGRLTGDFGWSGASIFLKDRGPGLDERITALRNRVLLGSSDRGYSLEATAGADLRKNILRIFDETFAITTVLLVISLLIAALGIATTLTILVLERAGQFQTMIATGAAPGQIRAIITWEAALMVIVGEALGLACGFVLSVLLIFVINRQSFGWTFLFTIDWTALAASFPLVCATALLAAVPAAQLVFRQPPAMVLREK